MSSLRLLFRPTLLRTIRPTRALSTAPRLFTDKLYAKTHEYITATTPRRVGISAFAAHALGDVVYVELPSVGDAVTKGEAFGAVESVKSASDLLSPVDGTVVGVNDVLGGKPGLVNADPEGEGWIIEVESEAVEAGEGLLGAEEYKKFTSE